MKDWPAPACEELERALAAHHARLIGTGVDADEVVADLRRHVETELGRNGGASVEQVQAVLRRLIESDDADPKPECGLREESDPAPGEKRLRRVVLHWIFLVILPAVTLGFEWVTGLCATELFDPIGRLPHLIAVAGVPMIFAAVLIWHSRPFWVARRRLLRAAAALACGVCAYYAIQFALLTPFAFVAIIVYGLGLLPLAPLFAFVTSLDLLAQLRRLDAPPAGSRAGPVWPLALAAVLLLVLTDLSGICASLGLRWSASDDEVVRARGLSLLRSRLVDPADIDHPWRVNGPASGTDAILGLLTGNSGRIFGAEFERVQFAATGGARDLTDPDLWRRTRGRGRAGDARWSLLGDLALDGSRLDGSIDPDLLCGYVEWTMTLRNGERWPLEGRATLQLPPGGVVSRVTLWIDGEEREAAFAGRAAATRAYESVAIVQRRDPILVTTAGPDRVRLRCFPVPADGRMKFRLGITFPLRPAPDGARAEVVLPALVETNFAVPSALKHSVWIAGAGDPDKPGHDGPDTELLRGPVAHGSLGTLAVTVPRDAARTVALARSIDELFVIEQEVRIAGGQARRLALVIDGNPRVWREQSSTLLEGLGGAGGGGVDLWLALDRPVRRSFGSVREAREFLAEAILSGVVRDAGGKETSIPHRGGFDNGEALAAALASHSPEGGTVMWLHGPQITSAGAGDAIRQALERGGAGVELVELSVVSGRNDILDALDGRPEVRHVGSWSVAAVRDEIARAGGGVRREVVRVLRSGASGDEAESMADTRHLARLWASEEVMRLAASGPARHAEAAALAVRHQLVTPLSGAVVLETTAQYDAHGLQAVDPATVPTVPDVASRVVLAIAVVVLVLAGWVVRRRSAGHA